MKKFILIGILVFCLCCVFTACRWIKFEETEDVQNVPTQESETNVIYYEGDTIYIPSTKGYRPNLDIPCLEYHYIRCTTLGDPLKTATGHTETIMPGETLYDAFILSDYQSYKDTLYRIVEDLPDTIGISNISCEKITEAIFEEADLLVVDFIGNSANRLYPRLGSLIFEEGLVKIEFQYNMQIASTADNTGVLYFIPIPKGYSVAEVTPVCVTDWTVVVP